MLLSIKRIEPQEKLFAFRLREDKDNILDDPIYYINATSEITQKKNENLSLSITPLKNQELITISYDANYCYMEYVIELEHNADAYSYQATRIIGEQEEVSNIAYIESLPSKVKGLELLEDETVYDELTTIPTHIALTWDDYDIASNVLATGISIYYSTSPIGLDTWTGWEKVRNLNTGDNTGDISVIPLTQSGVVVEVPQLKDTLRPKDIRFGVVAISENLQSSLSNIVGVATKNMSATSYFTKIGFAYIENGSKEDTIEQIKNSRLVNPYYTISFDKSFAEDSFIWCERRYADDSQINTQKLYMRMAATTQMIGIYKANFYLPLPTSYSYKVLAGDTPIPSEYDVKTSMLSFTHNKMSNLTIVMTNSEKRPGSEEYKETFRESTRKLIERLPTWFKIRRNPVGSIGAYFLDVFGMELESIEKILEYASNQTHILTLDQDQLTQIYKAELPNSVCLSDEIVVTAKSGEILERCSDLSHFLKPPYFLSDEEQVYHNNLYLVDYEEKLIYTRKSHTDLSEETYGEILFDAYRDTEENPYISKSIPLKPHKLWNFYDEFGLLLDTARLKDESNEDYKLRILDVFKNPSSSAKQGLANGIARELGIRKTVIWSDTSTNLLIKDRMIMCNMITINGETLPLEKVWIDSNDYIFINADKKYPKDSEVSYISGLEMHALNNRKDDALYNQLFQPNGLATTLLLQYVRRIKDNIPVEWDEFKWNEGYWDANLPENGGIAFVPSMMDASISGFDNNVKTKMNNTTHYKR